MRRNIFPIRERRYLLTSYRKRLLTRKRWRQKQPFQLIKEKGKGISGQNNQKHYLAGSQG